LVKNQNFGQKSKFWPKIKFFLKNKNFQITFARKKCCFHSESFLVSEETAKTWKFDNSAEI